MTDFLDGIDEFLEGFTPEERAVSQAVFRRILGGETTQPETLATALDMAPAVIDATVARLVERGTVARDPASGDLVGARGLTLAETSHRLTIDGRSLYAYCAVDAVGIPVALGRYARVESRCHACGRPLDLTIEQGRVIDAPAGTVIWAAERDLGRSLREYT